MWPSKNELSLIQRAKCTWKTVSLEILMAYFQGHCLQLIIRLSCRYYIQGRNWLPKSGWACSNAAHCSCPARRCLLIGDCPPCPPATYSPGYNLVASLHQAVAVFISVYFMV